MKFEMIKQYKNPQNNSESDCIQSVKTNRITNR